MIGAPLQHSIRHCVETPSARRSFAINPNARRYAAAFGTGLLVGAVWMFVFSLL